MYRNEAPMLNNKYFPKDYLAHPNYLDGNNINAATEFEAFKYPHLQMRNISFEVSGGKRLLDAITLEVRGGELLAVMSTNGKRGGYFNI